MEADGGCYCGALRYHISGEALTKGMCFCRECQHVASGGPNVLVVVPEAAFTYTRGQPKSFQRSDLEVAAIREFCGNCGVQILTRSPRRPGVAIVKVGTLDDPDAYGMPDVAIYTGEKRAYHVVPEGVTAFEGKGAGARQQATP
jgi:hypothetical protein